MPAYSHRTPGVYFEWDNPQPIIGRRRTDIAGFVGIAQRGPLHEPRKVESWTQFTGIFGGHTQAGYLAYAVAGFFNNGGRTCWVVRLANPDLDAIQSATLRLSDGTGQGGLLLTASSPGSWARDMSASVLRTGVGRFTLTLRLPGGEQEVWRDLTVVDGPVLPRGARQAVSSLNAAQHGSRLVTAEYEPPSSQALQSAHDPDAANLQDRTSRFSEVPDGLKTLRLEHFNDGDRKWGLAALEAIDEVSIIAMPDIMPKPVDCIPPGKSKPRCDTEDSEALPVESPALSCVEFAPPLASQDVGQLQIAMLVQCEKLKDRFAILDMPPEVVTPEEMIEWRRDRLNIESAKYAALYTPWIMVPDPLLPLGNMLTVPPSGHVAGVYARSDLRTGPHKPPANELLEDARNTQVPIDDVWHANLNDEGINVIRAYNGRGVRVAGARTLHPSPEWRYVNVRRLLTMIEEDVDESTQWAVFEPNNNDLWRDVDRQVAGYLNDLWRKGMLDGATSEEAYFVRCDETTNPRQDTDAGRLTCLIGVQPPWPAEFVVVRIGMSEGATQIEEAVGRGSRNG